MKAYLYDKKTKEYLSEYDCQPSPLEPGKYLIPGNATTTAPPEGKDGYVLVWNGSAWTQVEDHRQKRDTGGVIIESSGTPYWLEGDTWDTPARYMTEIGPLPDGALRVAPEKTPEELADEAMRIAKNERSDAVSRITVEVDGLVFDGDETSQDRMTRAITMFTSSGLPADTTTSWVLADNTVAQVTIGQLTQALLLAGQKQTELWTKPYEDAA